MPGHYLPDLLPSIPTLRRGNKAEQNTLLSQRSLIVSDCWTRKDSNILKNTSEPQSILFTYSNLQWWGFFFFFLMSELKQLPTCRSACDYVTHLAERQTRQNRQKDWRHFTDAYQWWKELITASKHTAAECVSCHVITWHILNSLQALHSVHQCSTINRNSRTEWILFLRDTSSPLPRSNEILFPKTVFLYFEKVQK